MPVPIQYSSAPVDLSQRFQYTQTVAASPSAASETIIATLTLSNFANLQVIQGVELSGWAAYTVGTNGVSVTLKIRQTNVSGTVINVGTGALTKTAASLYVDDVMGTDAGAGVGVYVLTMTVGSGSATSTVSAVYLSAQII